jgi:hypothetical protein
MHEVKSLINKCVHNINRPDHALTGALIAICHRERALETKFTANWFITITDAHITGSRARANVL